MEALGVAVTKKDRGGRDEARYGDEKNSDKEILGGISCVFTKSASVYHREKTVSEGNTRENCEKQPTVFLPLTPENGADGFCVQRDLLVIRVGDLRRRGTRLELYEGHEDFLERWFGFVDNLRAAGGDLRMHFLGHAVADNGPFAVAAFASEGPLKNGGWGLRLIETDVNTPVSFEYVCQFVTKDDFSSMDYAHMVGDAFDFVQEVGREEDGSAFICDGPHDGAKDVSPHDGIEAGGGFIQQEELGAVRESCDETGLGSLSSGKGFDFLRWAQIQALDKVVREGVVPLWVYASGVAHEFVDPHPSREVAVFRQVADASEYAFGVFHGVAA